MKILVLADKESPYLWDYFEKSKFEGIDLIISCGDLAADLSMTEFFVQIGIDELSVAPHQVLGLRKKIREIQ